MIIETTHGDILDGEIFIADGGPDRAKSAGAGKIPVSVDTGWTANSSAGDKTAVLTDYVSGITPTIVTALNVVSAGAGDAVTALADIVVLLVDKVQALETALAAGELPNA